MHGGHTNWSTRSISRSGMSTHNVWNHSSQLLVIVLVVYGHLWYQDSPVTRNHHAVFIIPSFAYTVEFVVLFVTVVYIWFWHNIIHYAWDDRGRTRPGINIHRAFKSAAFRRGIYDIWFGFRFRSGLGSWFWSLFWFGAGLIRDSKA